MCQRVECPRCAKPTYAGCGRHVEAVLRDVPPEDRCRCREEKASRGPDERSSFLRRLLGF